MTHHRKVRTGAAGVRRIEALTGSGALQTVHQQDQAIRSIAHLLKSDPSKIETRIQKLLEQQKELEKEMATLQSRLNSERSGELLDQAVDINGVKLLTARTDGLDGKQMREMADQLRDKMESGVIILGGVNDGKAALLVTVSGDLTGRLQAGTIIKGLAEQVGGRGGGRPELAQAGGSAPENLEQALSSAPELVAAAL